jgi:hypothetical protein
VSIEERSVASAGVGLESVYLGMHLRSPLVASPSPHTGRLDTLLRLDDAGIGAVVLPSLFEEEVEAETMTFDERLSAGSGVFGEATDYWGSSAISCWSRRPRDGSRFPSSPA